VSFGLDSGALRQVAMNVKRSAEARDRVGAIETGFEEDLLRFMFRSPVVS
jgi:hypothetical protein